MAMDAAEVLRAERKAARVDPGRLFANAVSVSKPMVLKWLDFPVREEFEDEEDGCGSEWVD